MEEKLLLEVFGVTSVSTEKLFEISIESTVTNKIKSGIFLSYLNFILKYFDCRGRFINYVAEGLSFYL
jgi:hypothetical protein